MGFFFSLPKKDFAKGYMESWQSQLVSIQLVSIFLHDLLQMYYNKSASLFNCSYSRKSSVTVVNY